MQDDGVNAEDDRTFLFAFSINTPSITRPNNPDYAGMNAKMRLNADAESITKGIPILGKYDIDRLCGGEYFR
jgi:hypothetical protein